MRFMPYDMYRDRGGTESEEEYNASVQERSEAFNNSFRNRGSTDRPRFQETALVSLDRERPKVAPLTGTTAEGVMENFQPDPQRDIRLRRLLNESIDGQSTPEMQNSSFSTRSESSSVSQTNNEEPEVNYSIQQRGTDQPNFDFNYSSQNPQENFLNQYAGFDDSAFNREPGFYPTFPEYMPEYSPRGMGDFGSAYSQDNQYQYYEDYNSPAQYAMDQMGGFGSFDMGNFLDMGQVPQGQNNFSDAGNFFATANAQMEQAAKQETQADKRIRMAGSRGSAAKRF